VKERDDLTAGRIVGAVSRLRNALIKAGFASILLTQTIIPADQERAACLDESVLVVGSARTSNNRLERSRGSHLR